MIKKTNFKFIYLEITNYCNMNCPFCVSPNVEKRRYLEMDKVEWYLSEICQFTNTVYLHVLGEPLLHPSFVDIVNMCKKYNLNVRLTTNGTLLSKYDFSKLNVKKISISLQSLIQYSDELIDEYFENISSFLNNVSLKLKNRDLGIDFRIWNNKDNKDIENFNNKIYYYLLEKLNINEIPNVRISEASEFEWPDVSKDDNINNISCLGGKTQLGVLSNGDVVLCCLDYSGQTRLGNLNDNSLNTIINGEVYQNVMKKFQAGEAYFDLCKKCNFRNRFN